MGRGFGIPATADSARARRVASECERLGYTSIWSNDVPNADGLVTVAEMAGSTHAIRLGVGVIPLDRRPAQQVLERLRSLQIPLDRLVLGVGAGQSKAPLRTVKEGVARLRGELGEGLTIAVAAMGRQMCRLAARHADVVLFNWMLPFRIVWASSIVEAGERERRDPGRVLRAAYIRVALEPGGFERLGEEAARYNRIPAYRKHFEEMGAPLATVGVAAHPSEIPSRLAAYDKVLDEAIVRALPALDTVEDTLAVAKAAAPAAVEKASHPAE